MTIKFTWRVIALVLIGIAGSISDVISQKADWNIVAFEKKLKEAGSSAQILDARSVEEYHQNHLPGAISFSVKDENDYTGKVQKLHADKPVFIYSIGNGRSNQLAKKLQASGFKEVYELPGGLSNWVGTGRSVESSVPSGYTLSQYQQLTTSTDQLVLVDLSSRYCGSCKRLIPIVDSVAQENAAKIKLVKVEFFDNKQLAKELQVEAIPHLILYKAGKPVWEKTGVTPKSEIQSAINAFSAAN